MRVRAAMSGLALVAGALAALAPVAEAAGPVTTVVTVLPGGAGDGGPAIEAQVNATVLAADPDGDVWFWDRLVDGVRTVDAQTGVVTTEFANVGAPRAKFSPAVPNGVRPTGMWRVGTDLYLAYSKDGSHLWRVSANGTVTPVAVPASSTGYLRKVLLVAQDESIVVQWSREWPIQSTVEIVPGNGGAPRVLIAGDADAAAQAADGTLFLLTGGEWVDRVRPDGTVDRLTDPRSEENRFIAVTPDGSRVVLSQRDESNSYGAPYYTTRLRGFDVGGPLGDIATMAPHQGLPCDHAPTGLALEASGTVLSACGGAIRRFAVDPAAPGDGTVIAGRNLLRGWIDSPDGTPLSRAYLGRVQDVATDPRNPNRVAMATRGGVYTIAGTGSTATLEQLVPGLPGTEIDPESMESSEDEGAYEQQGVDLEFDANGVLYVLQRDHGRDKAGWLIHRVGTDNKATLLAGGGASTLYSGIAASNAQFYAGNLTTNADGSKVFLSQNYVNKIWALDTAKKTFAVHAGEPLQYPNQGSNDQPALRADLDDIRWLGRDATTGELLIGTHVDDSYLYGYDYQRVPNGNLQRLDGSGYIRAVSAGAGPTWASIADGSVLSSRPTWKWDYTKSDPEAPIWRRWSNGAFSPAMGPGAIEPAVAASLARPRIASAGGTSITVTEQGGPTSEVRRVTLPSTEPWTAPAPTMTVVPVAAGQARYLDVTVTVPAARAPWQVRIKGTVLPSLPDPDVRRALVEETLPAEGGSRTWRIGSPEWVAEEDAQEPYASAPVPPTEWQNLQPGQKYGLLLQATSGELVAPAISRIVKAPGYPSVLTGSAASATKVGTGKTVTLQAVLRDGRDQQVLANRPVALQTRTRGTTTWRTVATAQTTASGAVSAAVAIPYSTEARWVFAGAGQFEPTTGRTVTVSALPTLTLCCSTTIKLGKSYTFTDSISAKKSGLVLTLQRKSGTTWKTAATCKTSSSGTCKITVKPTKTGTYSYRLYRAGDSLLLGATSSTRTLKVVK